MPDATELCTTADLKTLLGISTTSQDALLAVVKAGVEKWAKTFTGRDLLTSSSPYTEYHNGDGGGILRLDQHPITDIDSINIDGARVFAAATAIPEADIISDARAQALGFVELLTYRFSRGVKNVKVVYSAGYATVPEDLSMAVKQIVAKQFKVAEKKMFAEGSYQVGDTTVTLSPDAFPKDALEVLRSYRRVAAF